MKIKKQALIKLIRDLSFFILLIVFTFWFLFRNQDPKELVSTIKSVNIIYVVIGAILLFLSICMESYNVKKLLVSLGEREISMLKALKFSLIGFFFSAITPAATGGQPVEIYYMSKEKLSSAKSTLALIIQLCGFQISCISLSLISIILNPSILEGEMLWFYLIGLLLNGTALTFMLIAVFSKKLTRKIIDLVIIIMRGLRLRNVEKKVNTVNEGLAKYNASSDFILSHKIEFVKSIIRVMLQVIMYHSIAYCTYLAFGFSEYNFLQVFSTQAVLYTTVSSIPLPGSIGVSESLFIKIYGRMYPSNLIKSSMLVFRFASFYLHVIISVFVVIYNAIKMRNVKGHVDEEIYEADKTIEFDISTLKETV